MLDKAEGRKDLADTVNALSYKGALVLLPKVPGLIQKFSFARYGWVLLAAVFVIIRNRPGVFHAALGGILLTPIAKLLGAKTIVELTSPDNVRFVSRFRRLINPVADIFVCVSESVKKKAIDDINLSLIHISEPTRPY